VLNSCIEVSDYNEPYSLCQPPSSLPDPNPWFDPSQNIAAFIPRYTVLKTWFTAMPPALRKIGARNSKAFRGTLVQPSTCFADNICRTSAPLQQRRNFLPNPFDSGLQTVSASRTIQHPTTVIYNVISTVSSYSAFVP
jgi:hypothetical protein